MVGPTTLVLSEAVGLIGAIGAVSAFAAIRGIRLESLRLERAEQLFLDGEAVHSAFSSQPDSDVWLSSNGIDPDSHVGDYIGTVWRLRKANRFASLAELVPLFLIRERSRWSAIVAGGIGATLLICGIAGTLWAIHPILSEFKIGQRSNGEVADSAQSADNVADTIHSLGEAFAPSLTAMTCTLLVALFRGIYSQRAYKLRRRLDKFAHETLLSFFREKTIGEELDGLQVRLSYLVDMMEQRDASFAVSRDALAEAIKDLRSVAPELRKASEKAVEATNNFAKGLDEFSDTLGHHMGSKSALVKAINRFGLAADVTNDGAITLSKTAAQVTELCRTGSSAIDNSASVLEKAVATLPEQIRLGWEKGGEAIISESAKIIHAASSEVAANVGTMMTETITAAGRPVVEAMQKGVLSAEEAALSIQQTVGIGIRQLQSNIASAGNLIVEKGREAALETSRTINDELTIASSVLQSSAQKVDTAVGSILTNNGQTQDAARKAFNEAATEFKRVVVEKLCNIDTVQERVIQAQDQIQEISTRLSRPGPLARLWVSARNRLGFRK